MIPKPEGAKPRKPEGLMKGVRYEVLMFAQEESIYANRKIKIKPIKLLAIIVDEVFGPTVQFHVFIPYEFDNKPESIVLEWNRNIKLDKKKYIVYYSNVSNCYEMTILEDGEEVNKKKLEAVRLIEESERNAALKRANMNVDLFDSRKRFRSSSNDIDLASGSGVTGNESAIDVGLNKKSEGEVAVNVKASKTTESTDSKK